MRKILFRGKDGMGIWHYGYYIHHAKSKKTRGQTLTENDFNTDYIVDSKSGISYEVIGNTVGQYIGLKDKNNVKIFEGDTIRFAGDNTKNITYTVIYSEDIARFIFVRTYNCGFGTFSSTDTTIKEYEVVGNIYETQEGDYEKKFEYKGVR